MEGKTRWDRQIGKYFFLIKPYDSGSPELKIKFLLIWIDFDDINNKINCMQRLYSSRT